MWTAFVVADQPDYLDEGKIAIALLITCLCIILCKSWCISESVFFRQEKVNLDIEACLSRCQEPEIVYDEIRCFTTFGHKSEC